VPGLNSGRDTGSKGPTNWAYIDQRLMEVYSYTLLGCWDLTIPEVAVHLEKLSPTVAEPEWFVKGWRGAKTDEERLALLQRMMED
jgi:hypothetical protein